MFEQTFENIDDILWREPSCTTELDCLEQISSVLFPKHLGGLTASQLRTLPAPSYALW